MRAMEQERRQQGEIGAHVQWGTTTKTKKYRALRQNNGMILISEWRFSDEK